MSDAGEGSEGRPRDARKPAMRLLKPALGG
jgi:hypothetical protein